MKEGWTYKTLGDITTSMADGPFGSNLKKEHYTDKPEVRIIQLSNIGEDGWREENTKYTTFEHLKSIQRSEVQPGDIVIAKMMPAGRAILCPSHEAKFVLSSDAVRATLIQGVNRRFVLYSINSPYFRKQVYENVSGSGRVRTSLTKLKACRLLIPGIAEQERIVERLDAAFAQIDELKSNAERQLAEARALFQSALAQAMQPKPGWQEKKLVNVCDIFGRIGFRGYTTKDLVCSQNDGAISLSPSNIQNGEMDYSKRTYISWFKYNESPEIKIFNGDILLVKTGSSYGKSALVKDLPHEATINPQSVVLKNFRINNEFFAYQLRTERVKKEFDQFVSGTAIPTFSQAKLGTVPIYLPSEIEQEQIVSYLNSLNNHVRELEEISRKTAAECDAMKQALLRQIFE